MHSYRFNYLYCNVCSILGILFHCVVLCTVCVLVCTVLLLPGVNPIAINKHIIILIYYIDCLSAFCITVARSIDRPHVWQSSKVGK
jgi:hypothetical protein